jgi:hypothetical protein
MSKLQTQGKPWVNPGLGYALMALRAADRAKHILIAGSGTIWGCVPEGRPNTAARSIPARL